MAVLKKIKKIEGAKGIDALMRNLMGLHHNMSDFLHIVEEHATTSMYVHSTMMRYESLRTELVFARDNNMETIDAFYPAYKNMLAQNIDALSELIQDIKTFLGDYKTVEKYVFDKPIDVIATTTLKNLIRARLE